MLRIIFIFTLLLCATFTVSAQRFKAGLRMGIAATQVSGDQLSGYNKAGIVAGGIVSTELSQKFDVSMEILYFQKGSRKNANVERDDYTTYLLRINYFEIPVLVNWKFSKRFSFEAGPTFSALVSTLEEDEFGQLEQPREFSSFELGVAGGMNVRLVNNFHFNVRAANSVLPVREHVSGEGYRLNRGQYNSCLMFSFHYLFGKPVN